MPTFFLVFPKFRPHLQPLYGVYPQIKNIVRYLISIDKILVVIKFKQQMTQLTILQSCPVSNK